MRFVDDPRLAVDHRHTLIYMTTESVPHFHVDTTSNSGNRFHTACIRTAMVLIPCTPSQ